MNFLNNINTHNPSNIQKTLSHWHSFRLKIIIESVVVGFFAGLVATFYRFLLEGAINFSRYIYSLQLKNTWMIPLWVLLLVTMGYIVGLVVKKDPMTSGSGIPQVEGILVGKLNMNWLSVIVGKFIGGVLCIGAGLSLGREGPSIQIGAAVGQGVSRILKRIKIEEKLLVTSGASAGLSAAFSAPLAGAIFALEEVHKNFSPIVMTSALAASITSSFIAKHFFGLSPIFNFQHLGQLPLENYVYIAILGILVGVLGVLFNKILLGTQTLYSKQKWLPTEARPIIPFLLAAVLGLFLPEVLGGGSDLVTSIMSTSFSIKLLIIILIIKFCFTMICFGSSAPGGIFLPLLVLGALVGNIYSDVLSYFFSFDYMYKDNFIILAMAGYFSAIVKSPITGTILITEMTGSFTHLLPIAMISLISYIVADTMNSKPVYEALLERILNKNNSSFEGEDKTKIVIEIPVCVGSTLEGKKIKDITWPDKCLIVGIRRGEKEFIPKGNTAIYLGDYLVILTSEDTASASMDHLLKLSGSNDIKL